MMIFLQIRLFATVKTHQHRFFKWLIVLSDGIHAYSSVMLATQLNQRVTSGELDAKAIIKLNNYTCNIVQETRKVLVILDLTVLTCGSETDIIGQPKPYNDQSVTNPRPTIHPQQNLVDKSENRIVFPISSLTPYQNRWTIRTRVTSKSEIRKWSNSRGEGKLFSVDLIDESGEIRATAFRDQVEKFYDVLEVNKVYYISRCSIKTANKNFTSIKNDYEMTFTNETAVEPCDDIASLPKVSFNFVRIGDIENQPAERMIDVVGVVKSADDVVTINTKSNRQVNKRDIELVDDSGKVVRLTLWGTNAEEFDGSQFPVVAVRGARVTEFGGRSLSVVGSSQLMTNPDIPEAHILRGWFDVQGKDQELVSISTKRGDIGSPGFSGNWKNISDIHGENLGQQEKADYFNLKATIIYIRKENLMYKACPKEDCNKKVIDQGGSYRCEKCNQTFPDFKYRLMISASIVDSTGSNWLTFFQETGEAMLKCTAQQLGAWKENDESKYEHTINEALFQSYILKVRAKMESFNDENRLKCSCVNLTPMDYVQQSRRLLEGIRRMQMV
ncbi:uncharacterized protein TRIADDRAFT_50671 [Trichoplax adhaerens]|uniref:Replication protein A subunit n=1 Tax=Trichoplax adhaerens TaxID=10228 RepID=B3S571_TRIAD|nr:hypothetical protein TRIADDRAFT_50671 [Trichoplax adhaerens]EDV22084.1 hypothetical protein TRIADDRAFT_50671 [Trichoplax adhaerens]|eukprot:XP_002115239.1 hypothetical protein TRIADDRAFT_50671 [Trichoplax adhaerens]